jgi:hypothetical protein
MIVSGLSVTRQLEARILGISNKPVARIKASLFWPCRVGHFSPVPKEFAVRSKSTIGPAVGGWMLFEPVRDAPSCVHAERTMSRRWRVSFGSSARQTVAPIEGTFRLLLGCQRPQSTRFLAQKCSMPLKKASSLTPIVPSHAAWRALWCQLIQGGVHGRRIRACIPRAVESGVQHATQEQLRRHGTIK